MQADGLWKYKYEAAVKAREARKNQTNTVLKEIRFRLKIDTHDYETKRGHALRFLGAGDIDKRFDCLQRPKSSRATACRA